jgi:hypothetical protein
MKMSMFAFKNILNVLGTLASDFGAVNVRPRSFLPAVCPVYTVFLSITWANRAIYLVMYHFFTMLITIFPLFTAL